MEQIKIVKVLEKCGRVPKVLMNNGKTGFVVARNKEGIVTIISKGIKYIAKEVENLY